MAEEEEKSAEERQAPIQGAALNRLGAQLAGAFKDARRRLWTFTATVVVLSCAIVGAAAALYGIIGWGDLRLDAVFRTGILILASSFLTAVGLYPVFRRFEKLLLETVLTVARINIDLLSMLGKLAEMRDSNTAGHNLRTTIYMVLFAEALGLTPEEVVRVAKSAFLHDIGKLVVAHHILNKPGPLTAEERAEMQTHVLRGAEIVSQSQLLTETAPVVASHHEHYDGSGYPQGLKGEEIPKEARMFALVDVFDALTSMRVYKSAQSVEEALQVMEKERGTHFDPVLFDKFAALAPGLAKQLPQGEAALTTMLMRRLFPYLDCFLLGKSLVAPRKSRRKAPACAA